jgi:hypothetical protein
VNHDGTYSSPATTYLKAKTSKREQRSRDEQRTSKHACVCQHVHGWCCNGLVWRRRPKAHQHGKSGPNVHLTCGKSNDAVRWHMQQPTANACRHAWTRACLLVQRKVRWAPFASAKTTQTGVKRRTCWWAVICGMRDLHSSLHASVSTTCVVQEALRVGFGKAKRHQPRHHKRQQSKLLRSDLKTKQAQHICGSKQSLQTELVLHRPAVPLSQIKRALCRKREGGREHQAVEDDTVTTTEAKQTLLDCHASWQHKAVAGNTTPC